MEAEPSTRRRREAGGDRGAVVASSEGRRRPGARVCCGFETGPPGSSLRSDGCVAGDAAEVLVGGGGGLVGGAGRESGRRQHRG